MTNSDIDKIAVDYYESGRTLIAQENVNDEWIVVEDPHFEYGHVYDYDKYKDCYVKFVVRKKTKPKDLEKIIDRFYQANLAEFNIIEEVDLFVDTTDTVDQTQDTVSIISKEIDSLTDVCADRLKTIINDLYNESYDLSSEDKE
jgi:hypothetical protein